MSREIVRSRRPSEPVPLGAPEATDAELVLRARDGDRWALEALYRRHAPAVLRTSMRILARRCEAEDVTHDAFANTLEALDTLREPAAFRSWLMRTAVRAARWKLRRRAFGRALGLEPGPLDATLDQLARTEVSPEARVALSEVQRVLERVPSTHRIAWVLREVEGHSLAEVAEYSGVSLATVKRWIRRTEQRLVETLGEGWQ